MEGSNNAAFGLTREVRLDRGDEFVGGKRVPGQTFTGSNIDVEDNVEARGSISTLCKGWITTQTKLLSYVTGTSSILRR